MTVSRQLPRAQCPTQEPARACVAPPGPPPDPAALAAACLRARQAAARTHAGAARPSRGGPAPRQSHAAAAGAPAGVRGRRARPAARCVQARPAPPTWRPRRARTRRAHCPPAPRRAAGVAGCKKHLPLPPPPGAKRQGPLGSLNLCFLYLSLSCSGARRNRAPRARRTGGRSRRAAGAIRAVGIVAQHGHSS